MVMIVSTSNSKYHIIGNNTISGKVLWMVMVVQVVLVYQMDY